jgi:hypothetical protein
MHIVIIATLLAVALATPVHAQVHVDIGIHFPGPPLLVVVPETPRVQYVPPAPAESANLFFYNDQYWAYTDGGWYLGRGYNGPWIAVEPQFVPRHVLLVPVRYYHMPPGHWGRWEARQPPRWREEYGREWADKRAWKEHEHEREDEQGENRGHGHGQH